MINRPYVVMTHLSNALIFSLVLLFIASVMSMSSASAAVDKPFAEKHVVLQISDDDPAKQTLVLNVASNLLKHYGPDKVEVEIVAFGPGLKLLLAKNDNAERINGLAEGGSVRFSACDNTYEKMTKKLGHAPPLNANAMHVTAGVVQIMDLVDKGYMLIRP